ncbi:MAG: DUF4954 family protein [Bacteroidales bacterium]|nr:DUF4954 family protein [Bacteroidales bacterium]
MNYRNLKESEISQLEKNDCFSEDWSQIKVKPEFNLRRLHSVYFAGEVKLGAFSGKVEVEEGIKKPSGIYHSYIEDCSIGDDVYISNVRNLIGYYVDEDVAVENVGSLVVTSESTFGNGVELEVLNEGGGRELPICDKMTAQIAYLMVNYRHDQQLAENLGKLIHDYAETKRSHKGTIGAGARIIGTKTIRNVNIGSNAVIYGANFLEEGTVSSCKEDPVTIGEGVIAKGFIVNSGSTVDGGAILDHTFIGQSVQTGKQFSAEHSVLFANSEAFHSEAVSIFGGPYTVTHHKSTLLIAGAYSFYNAGSGSNKSNHLYKMGPVHQGRLERGSKTGSFSYMLWPTHVGPYSMVLGKHKGSFDTSQFPFSYIDAKSDRSELIPALNLFTVGTLRDIRKWPKRDKRRDPNKLDLIHFDLFSPFVVQKMVNAGKILKQLKDKASKEQRYVSYKGVHIPRLILRTAQKYYEIGIRVYLGHELAKQIDQSKAGTFDELKQELIPRDGNGKGKWVDVSGMFASQQDINRLCEEVKAGKVISVDALTGELEEIYNNYPASSWEWCSHLIGERLGIHFKDITKEQLVEILRDWKENAEKMNNMILKDAQQEFGSNSKIGFGVDGDETTRDKDFASVRGAFEENSFVQELNVESEEIGKRADGLIEKLESM